MSRDVCGVCWGTYDDKGLCECKPAKVIDPAAELRRLHDDREVWKDYARQKEALVEKISAALDVADQQKIDDEALLRQALNYCEEVACAGVSLGADMEDMRARLAYLLLERLGLTASSRSA
jgi:hypothetical protein